MPPLETFNLFLALGTIALGVVSAALLVAYVFRLEVGAFVGKYGVWLALLVILGGISGSLIHSELYGLPPCPLCWWQRIFLYPQAAVFVLALMWRVSGDVLRFAANTSIALSTIGLGIALYHHALQMFPGGFLPCPAEGEVSCAKILFLEFGYITYPLMGAILFASLIILMIFVRSALSTRE